MNFLVNEGTSWTFIPPRAPHFGGLWEAGVKSVKYHLRRNVGDHTLTFEEMSTLLCEIEACLNSRPLYPLSNHPSDLSALTPGHFLVGETLTNVPEPSPVESKPHLLSRWKQVTNMKEHFWRRWSAEYVQSLQPATKWQQNQANIAIGTMVLLKNEQLPPTKWALARVVTLHPGPDGLVRVATIKTATSTLRRPIVKLRFTNSYK